MKPLSPRSPILAAALLLCVLVAPALGASSDPPASGVPPPVVPQGFGVEIHFTTPARGEMSQLSQAGFGFVRMDMPWGDVEKTRGAYDFQSYDALTDDLAAAHCRAVYIVDYYNPLYEGGLAPHTSAGRDAFARFAAAAAAHFRGKGIIWEIWNEPNGTYWAPEPDTHDYALLAVDVARAIHQADPKACVIAPAASEVPLEFLRQVFSCGLLKYIDAVSIHPYRGKNPETVAPDYLALRKLIAACTVPGTQPVPIVCSEWGYPSNPNWGNTVGEAPPITEDIQGRYILREWLCNLALGVNLTDWYDWREDGTDPKNPEHSFGTIHQDGTPKPAYIRAQALIHDLHGYRFMHRLPARTPDDWRLLFRKGSSLAVVSWTTDPATSVNARTPHVRSVAPSDGDYAALLGISAVQYSAAPLVATASNPAHLPVTVFNQSLAPMTARVAVAGMSRTLRLASRQEQTATFALRGNPASSEDLAMPVQVMLNGKAIPGLPAVTLATVGTVDLQIAPTATGREVQVDALGAPFRGTIHITTAGKTISVPANLDAFHSMTLNQDVDPGKETSMIAKDPQGRTVATMSPRHFQALDYPKTVQDKAAFVIAATVSNTSATAPAPVVVTGVATPAAVAIAMPDQPVGKWSLKPAAALRIPDGARALVLWVRADNSLAIVRTQYTDSTGQVFQQTLNWINWKGWKLVRIPLAGIAPPTAMGGAGDDVRHYPLHWEVVFMADAFRARSEPNILIAAPYYEMP